MKNIKRISLVLTLVFVLSSIFTVSAFAEKADDYFEVNTDILYAKVHDDFDYDPYGSMHYYETYYFSDFDLNSIQFLVLENNKAPNGINGISDEQAIELVEDYYGSSCGYVVENAKVTKATVNGISALKIDGALSYFPFDTADYKNDECYYGMCAYLLATRENIFIIVYESCEEEVEIEHFAQVISTVLVNGTYFEGDALTVSHDFSSAPAYKDAAIADSENFDDSWMDDDFYTEDGPIFDEEFFSIFEDGFSVIMIIICVFTMILPTIIFIILAIVFGVKYSKNKKKLEEYEARYGFKGINGYNAQPNNIPYGYQPYVAQQPNVSQQQAAACSQQQLNVEQASNLAPEFQDSQADENK